MRMGRLEAFSDGVIAIIITIMVLEIKVPHGDSARDLVPLLPVFLSYVLSFVYVGIYWNNHHHMLQTCTSVTGAMLWANLHLLFWLSLFPFATGWMGENHFTAGPTALYGGVLLMAAIAYYLLAAGHHPRAGAGLDPEESGRARLEGQAVAAALRRRDRGDPVGAVALRGHPRRRRSHLADSGPADRKRPAAPGAAACLISAPGRLTDVRSRVNEGVSFGPPLTTRPLDTKTREVDRGVRVDREPY